MALVKCNTRNCHEGFRMIMRVKKERKISRLRITLYIIYVMCMDNINSIQSCEVFTHQTIHYELRDFSGLYIESFNINIKLIQ